MNKLVSLIGDCVIAKEAPCILIGGGLDSAIILHHLKTKSGEDIYSYTVGYEGQENEFEQASKVAEHYGTIHRNILIRNLLDDYPEILKSLPFPRFSLWVFWAIKQAHLDGKKTCYLGEGGDEHFGGYWYKPKKGYIENWVDLLTWGLPTYKELFNIVNMNFEAPFMKLDWRETFAFYDYEQHKYFLRKAYRDILPAFVLNRKKNPASINYNLFWKKELSWKFPVVKHPSVEEIRTLWQIWVTNEWQKLHIL
jgi:asparagine synthetase B (glutamine-hydrolysing)